MSEEAKTLVPKLRFPEFKDAREWEPQELNQLGELVSGLTYSPEDVRESGLLVLRSSNVQNGQISLDDNVYVTPSIKGANLARPNDILICVRNGSKTLIGKNALIPDGMPLCTHGAFMTIFRSPTAKFIFQLFQTDLYQNQVDADLGATINSINGSKFLKYKFCVPKEPKEQQQIADCLSSLDDLITAQNQKVEALKQHKKGLMQQLFPAEGETVPKLRFPEFGNDGEWQEMPFNKVFSRVTSKNQENNLNVLTISAQMGLVSQLEYFNKSVSAKDVSGYYLLHKGDFAYNKSYSQGYPVGAIKLLKHYDKGVVSTLYICFRAKDKSDNLFFEQYFDAGLLNIQIEGIAQEGARNHGLLNLSVVDFFELTKLYLPSPEERKRIADFLTSIDELITSESDKVDALKEHKKGLMQQLFPTLDEV